MFHLVTSRHGRPLAFPVGCGGGPCRQDVVLAKGAFMNGAGRGADSAGGEALQPPGLDRKHPGRKWLLRASPLRTAARGCWQDAPSFAEGLPQSSCWVCWGGRLLGGDWKGRGLVPIAGIDANVCSVLLCGRAERCGWEPKPFSAVLTGKLHHIMISLHLSGL